MPFPPVVPIPWSRSSRKHAADTQPSSRLSQTRRFIWDRVCEVAKTATVLLTTHYMDEADALAGRIGIMARGKLRVLGSPQHLKTRHGGGYLLELKGPPETAAQAARFVRSFFDEVLVREQHGGYQSFELLRRFALGAAFEALEQVKERLGLESYTLSQTSLDQVFLNIAYTHTQEHEAELLAAPVEFNQGPVRSASEPRQSSGRHSLVVSPPGEGDSRGSMPLLRDDSCQEVVLSAPL